MRGDWNDYRVALAISRAGTMRAAATGLGVSHTTVARRLANLEAALGSRLFDRLPGGLRPTAEGERVAEAAAALEREIAGVERTVGGDEERLSGRVVVTLPEFLGTHVLVPHFADFSRRYVDIELELVPTYDLLDLSRREADVAIRFVRHGKAPGEELVGRRAVVSHYLPYASPDYLARTRLEGPDSPARWLGWSERARSAPWVRDSPYPHLPLWGGFDSPLLQVAACQQGLGLAILPTLLGDGAPGLVRVPGHEPEPLWDVWVLVHPDLRRTARLRVLRDFVVEAFRQEAARFEGRLSSPAPRAGPAAGPTGAPGRRTSG